MKEFGHVYPFLSMDDGVYILLNFMKDPRNVNSRDVAIHNRLEQARMVEKRLVWLGRGNCKPLTTLQLLDEWLDISERYTLRRNDIPKPEITETQVATTIEYFRQMSEKSKRYEQIGEYIHGLAHRQLWERDQKQLYISSSNPYWRPVIHSDGYIYEREYLGEWPNSWKWGLTDDELEEELKWRKNPK